MDGLGLAVILPAKNEERGVAAVIDEIHQLDIEPDIIVAEHGSTDNTVAVAKSKGARVISCPFPGKGIGVRHVLGKIVGDERYTYIVMLDADNTYPARHIPEIVKKLQEGADCVAGIRRDYGPGAMSFTHFIWNKLAAAWLSIIYGRKVPDALTGMWGFRANSIPALKLCSTGFQLEVDIWSGAILANLKIEMLPISYRARRWGEVKAKVSDVIPILAHALKRRLEG